jgi:hypothetical protein
MHLYNATVKLKNPKDTTWTHELPKEKLTPAEVHILKALHGADAVTNIKPIGDKNINHVKEIDRLRLVYNSPKRDVVTEVFGPQPTLPQDLPIAAAEEEDTPLSLDVEDSIEKTPGELAAAAAEAKAREDFKSGTLKLPVKK